MSFSLNFYRYDNDILSLAAGSGDSSVKSAIDREFAKRTAGHDGTAPEWEREFVLGRELAHQVIDRGYPDRHGKEELRHRLAAEWLTTVFRIPGHCEAQSWRWQPFYDTIHTVPGFSDPIPKIVSVLDEGRPFFGDSCPDESYYGYLTHDECHRFLHECERHRAAFEADGDARYCIGSVIRLFEFAIDGNCHLWLGFW